MLCLVTLCDPVDCSLPGSSVHGISQARILEWCCHALLQGIFPTQGSNPHCRWTLHHLNHQGSPLVFLFGIKHQESFLLFIYLFICHFSYIVAFPEALSTSAVPEDMNHPAVSSGRSMNCELKQWRWVWCIVTCHFQHFKPRGRMSCRSGWGRIHWQPRALWSMWCPVSLQNQILSSREQGFYLPFSSLYLQHLSQCLAR